MGRDKQGSSSGDRRCWHPHPAVSSFPCVSAGLLDPTVLCEGSSDLWGHQSPGSIKMGSPHGDPRQQGGGAAASSWVWGPRCIPARPDLQPGGTGPWLDIAPVWSPLASRTSPQPLGAVGGGGTLPRLPACPRKPPCAVSQRGGEGRGSHRGGFVRRAKASCARQPGRLPLPRSCLPAPRSFLLRLSSPDVPPSPPPWHPGSGGTWVSPSRRAAPRALHNGAWGGSLSSLPRPQPPSQTLPLVCWHPSPGGETESWSRELRAGEWRWAGRVDRDSGAGQCWAVL